MEVFALTNQGLKVPKREEMSGKLKEIQQKSNTEKMDIPDCDNSTTCFRIFFIQSTDAQCRFYRY